MDPNEGELDDAYKLWINIDEALSKKITILKSNNGADNCVNNGKSLMANYNLEFDTNINLFGCENGVIDLNEECFRPYRYDDYVSFSCHYNFIPFIKGFKCWEYKKVFNQVGNNNDDEELTFIEEEELVCRAVEEKDLTPEFNNSFDFLSNTFQQIIPDDEMREYLFTILSTGLTGLAIEKFFIFNGSGRNGKGLTNEFMELVLGDYFVDVSSLIYTENQKNKSTSGANPEIAKLDKKRYCVSREPEKSTPLKNSVIKGFTGGGNLQARMLYSSKTKVLLCLTAIMECNKKPPFDEEPTGADIERIVDILFGSVFTNEDNLVDEEKNIYKVNPELKPTIKTSLIHRNTMLNILLSQLLELKKQGYNTDAFKPEIVKLRSLEYLQNSYDIHNIFTTLFEVRCEENATKYKNWKGEVEDADWTLPKVIKKIKESKEFYELPKNKKKEYKTNGDIENFFNTNLFYKSIIYKDSSSHSTKFKSWRLKLEEEEEL
jgi:phage/plasmid-associated DNA primase